MRVSNSQTEFVDKAGLDHAINELKAYIDGISTGDIDLSSYVTKQELQAKLDDLHINIDLSSYATKEELTQAINSIDLSAYATKAEIPSLDGYATTEYVDEKVASVPTGGTVDLSNYYTKSEVYNKEETDALIPTVTNGVDGVSPTVTITKEGKVATITCTDVNGTTTATISDGADGTSSGGSSGVGSTEIYSTEEVAIGTWIDGSTIYRKVITMDLPAVPKNGYHSGVKVVEAPCNIMMLDWRAISYSSTTDSSNEYPWKIIHGDGFKSATVWSTKTTVNLLAQELNKSLFSVFHYSNPTNDSSGYIQCWYGSTFASKRCDFILDYIKVETA